jgi:hypothetical protein
MIMTKAAVVHWVVRRTFELLELDPIPVYWEMNENWAGLYDVEKRVILISPDYPDDKALRRTLYHEIRHYWQAENKLLNTEILFGLTDRTLPYQWRYEEIEAEEFAESMTGIRNYRYVPMNKTLGDIIRTISKHQNVQRRLVKVLARARYEYMSLRDNTSYKDFIEFLKHKTILKGGE